MGCSSFEVDIVVSGAGSYYNFQLRCDIHKRTIDNVAAHDERIGIFDSLKQLGAVCIFFENGERVSAFFDGLADALDCGCRKGLFGG